MKVDIDVYVDGATAPHGFKELQESWQSAWADLIPSVPLGFKAPRDLKRVGGLPQAVATLAEVRNPDVFFTLGDLDLIGGVEVTTHSPDGSNIEKRYPFLWASRELSIPGFVATPFQKWRAGGATNRLPHRHALRNLHHLQQWDPLDVSQAPIQLMPIAELQGHTLRLVEAELRDRMPRWSDLGLFFAARTAHMVGLETHRTSAALTSLKHKWTEFTKAVINHTTFTEPSSLIKRPDKWVQVYNARPDTGHWERGEGQFDSIDGRLMFTLETIEFTPPLKRPNSLEFWLPQITSSHPWIKEQRDRGYQSKRLRNIIVTLPARARVADFTVKFSEELSPAEWHLLESHPEACLERLDLPPTIVKLTEELEGYNCLTLAQAGLRNTTYVSLIEETLSQMLHGVAVSTHRAYRPGWRMDLQAHLDAGGLPPTILIPRIPSSLLSGLRTNGHTELVPAEECNKAQLLALRQLHRAGVLT